MTKHNRFSLAERLQLAALIVAIAAFIIPIIFSDRIAKHERLAIPSHSVRSTENIFDPKDVNAWTIPAALSAGD